MLSKPISYKKGFKYQLESDGYFLMLPEEPGDSIFNYNRNLEIRYFTEGTFKNDPRCVSCGPFLSLWPNGRVCIYQGYAWDGPSGPAFDTEDFMVPSMVHDAIYQLMRNGALPLDPYREIADEMMYQMCKERGMCGARAWWCKRGVRRFGKTAASVKRTIYTAP